jgi:hypothetical protein
MTSLSHAQTPPSSGSEQVNPLVQLPQGTDWPQLFSIGPHRLPAQVSLTVSGVQHWVWKQIAGRTQSQLTGSSQLLIVAPQNP